MYFSGRDNLFAGFSWVHMPTMEEVMDENNNHLDLVDESTSDSELAAEIELAAYELNQNSSVDTPLL